MPVNGSPLPWLLSWFASWSRTTLNTLTTLTRLIGTSSPLQTRMVMPTAGSTTACGGRPGQTTEAFLDARGSILTATEAFSEVEMRNIRDFVTTLDPVPVLGHCFH